MRFINKLKEIKKVLKKWENNDGSIFGDEDAIDEIREIMKGD